VEEHEVILEVEDPVMPEELLQRSIVEQTSTILQFLNVVVVVAVLPIILAKDPAATVVVAALPRASVVASPPAVVVVEVVVMSSEHCSSYLHTFF